MLDLICHCNAIVLISILMLYTLTVHSFLTSWQLQLSIFCWQWLSVANSTDSFLTDAGQATASTSQAPSADPTAPPTSHAADFLSNRLAKDPSPPPQPALQAPAAVKKNQYQAEPAPAPAPAVNSDGVAESNEGASAAAVAVSAWSAAEKQVGILLAASLHLLCICQHIPGRCITSMFASCRKHACQVVCAAALLHLVPIKGLGIGSSTVYLLLCAQH